MDAVAREKLRNAIRRACRWVDPIRSGETESFDEIAAQEGLGERHVRWLTPLAFLSPKVLDGILDGSSLSAFARRNQLRHFSILLPSGASPGNPKDINSALSSACV